MLLKRCMGLPLVVGAAVSISVIGASVSGTGVGALVDGCFSSVKKQRERNVTGYSTYSIFISKWNKDAHLQFVHFGHGHSHLFTALSANMQEKVLCSVTQLHCQASVTGEF